MSTPTTPRQMRPSCGPLCGCPAGRHPVLDSPVDTGQNGLSHGRIRVQQNGPDNGVRTSGRGLADADRSAN